jgi:predicted RNase H-like nuclease (RuvC/YqgF family)
MQPAKLIAITIALCTVIVIVASANAGNTAQSQDVRILDRRITVLEQRLYSIESSINRLEQSAFSQRSTVPPTSARDSEINLIREEIQKLELRVAETECGLLKLDERTTPSSSDTRRGSGSRPTDPCRINPSAPLRLSTRP